MNRHNYRRRLARITDRVTDAPPGAVADAATVIAYWDEWTSAYLHKHEPDDWPAAEFPAENTIRPVMAAEGRLRDVGILTFAGRPHPMVSDAASAALDALNVWYAKQVAS